MNKISDIVPKKKYFVTGIDTDCGKTFATGYIARAWIDKGYKVITHKPVQTGCEGFSEDIETHRQLMSTGLFPQDNEFLTCPQIFKYPSSPDLAASLENRTVDIEKIKQTIEELSGSFDTVIIEGAGGIMVPLTETYSTVDLIRELRLPLIFVTTPKLGSINQTFLNFEYCLTKGIGIDIVAYNLYGETSSIITEDTRSKIRSYLSEYMPGTKFIEIPVLDGKLL